MSTATNRPGPDGDGPLASGTEIFNLIPQRPPVTMVDTLYAVTGDTASTGLAVAPDNIFVSGGVLRESGILEHVAQSAAAFTGYDFWLRGITPKLGYIAEIKKFHIDALPRTGEALRTELRVLGSAGGMTLLDATVRTDTGLNIAAGQMKIYMTAEE